MLYYNERLEIVNELIKKITINDKVKLANTTVLSLTFKKKMQTHITVMFESLTTQVLFEQKYEHQKDPPHSQFYQTNG